MNMESLNDKVTVCTKTLLTLVAVVLLGSAITFIALIWSYSSKINELEQRITFMEKIIYTSASLTVGFKK